MKLLLVNNSRGWGGAEVMLYALCQGLRERGHHPVVVLRKGGVPARRFAEGGFDTRPVARGGLDTVLGLLKAAGEFRRERFDLVHVHRNHDLLTGKFLALCAGKLPMILTQHCQLGKSSALAVGLPDRIVTVSSFIGSGIKDRFPASARKLLVIPNGVDPAQFTESRRDFWSGKPELAGKGPFLGVVGIFYKNQEELIELLPHIRGEFPGVVLVIIGRDDERKPGLEALAANLGVSDAVHFAGEIPYGEMKTALAGLDLNVSAYRFEGFGLSVIEGMAVGTPFVGYRCGGYTDIVEDGVNGFLAGDRAGITARIGELLADREKSSQFGENARALARERFSQERMLNSYLSLYADLLSGGKA